ncbi:hypothetical protein MRX96_003655 [Rhipicephalus microplus]
MELRASFLLRLLSVIIRIALSRGCLPRSSSNGDTCDRSCTSIQFGRQRHRAASWRANYALDDSCLIAAARPPRISGDRFAEHRRDHRCTRTKAARPPPGCLLRAQAR